jgi:hypothetical protein
MVHLARGESPDGTPGTLTMDGEAVVFTDDDLRTVRFERSTIRRAKRLRGSPVLELQWIKENTVRRTAFYFVKPPPLLRDRNPVPPPTTSLTAGPMGTLGAMRKNSKRRQMRANTSYLQISGTDMRNEILEWAEEISALLRR